MTAKELGILCGIWNICHWLVFHRNAINLSDLPLGASSTIPFSIILGLRDCSHSESQIGYQL